MKSYSRAEFQAILEKNDLKADVSYVSREKEDNPDNYIVYYRLNSNSSLNADNKIHLRKALIQVNHYHKRKLDRIEELMLNEFETEPKIIALPQLSPEYLGTYYQFEILIKGKW